MFELIGLIASTVATIGGVAAYLDAVMDEEHQRRILSYIHPENAATSDDKVNYSDALRSILFVFVSGPHGQFDIFRSLTVILIIFVGTTIFSVSMVLIKTDDLDSLLPTSYTMKNLALPYAIAFAVSLLFGLFSIYQTTIFFRLFVDSKAKIEKGLLVYSDVALSYTISFIIAYLSILASVAAVDRSIETEVNVVLAEHTSDSGAVSLEQTIVGKKGYVSHRLSSGESDMHHDAYLAYVMRAYPQVDFVELECGQLDGEFGSDYSFSEWSKKITLQKCYFTKIRRPLGDYNSTSLLVTVLYPAIIVTLQSAVVGVFDVIYYTPTKIASVFTPVPIDGEAVRSDELFSNLLIEFPSVDNSAVQSALIISPFIMPSFYFTVLIYALATCLFLARQLPFLIRFKARVPLLNHQKPILSLSIYVAAIAVVSVCVVYLTT